MNWDLGPGLGEQWVVPGYIDICICCAQNRNPDPLNNMHVASELL